MYYKARYYDTGTGRFINRDPIEYLAGTANLYEYVSSNPLNWVDPLGLDKEKTSEEDQLKDDEDGNESLEDELEPEDPTVDPQKDEVKDPNKEEEKAKPSWMDYIKAFLNEINPFKKYNNITDKALEIDKGINNQRWDYDNSIEMLKRDRAGRAKETGDWVKSMGKELAKDAAKKGFNAVTGAAAEEVGDALHNTYKTLKTIKKVEDNVEAAIKAKQKAEEDASKKNEK